MKKQIFFPLLLVYFLVLGLAIVSCEFNVYDGFHVDVGGVDVGGIGVGDVNAGGNNGTSSPGGTTVEPNLPAPPAGPASDPPAPPTGPAVNPPVPPAGPGSNPPVPPAVPSYGER